MLHLYAVIPGASELPPALAGLDGAPVRRVAAAGAVAGVASEHAVPEVRPTEERVLRHAAVVEAVAAVVPAILPARFGDSFAGAGALAARLDERSTELAAGLEAVAGSVELGLRIASRSDVDVADQAAEAPSTGRAFMEGLARRADETRAIHEPLARLAERATTDRSGTARLLLTASYLVRRGRVDEFRREVERLQEQHHELALVCTGPWPPYSFVPDALARV